MKEYKIIEKDNHPVTNYNFKEIVQSIEDIFLKSDESEPKGLRVSFGRNGEEFHACRGYNGPRILLPEKYEESIKDRLEVIAGLKFGKIKCQ
jgi:hypothetical protein